MVADIALAGTDSETKTTRAVAATVGSTRVGTQAAAGTTNAKSIAERRIKSHPAGVTTVGTRTNDVVDVGVGVEAAVPPRADDTTKSLLTAIVGLEPPLGARLGPPIETVVSSLHLPGGERTVVTLDLTRHPVKMRSLK